MTLQPTPMTDDEVARLAPPDEHTGFGALTTDRGNLPLDSLEVTARITGLIADTELTQSFVNPHDVPLEATYIFPLPDRAAVTGMRMEAADRVIEGVLAEREKARRAYDRAIAAGQRASLAEEERPDVFTMRVGNIMPGERVRVRLTLAGVLPYEDGAATYRFPLVVAPRYIPGTPLDDAVGDGVSPDTDAVPDASRITPPVLLPNYPHPVRLSVSVTLDPAGAPVTGLRCSLHQVDVAEVDGVTRISLVPGQRPDRDLILRWQLGGEQTELAPALVLTPDAPDAQEGTFHLTVFPSDLPETARPRDVVLVLDRSGSMNGWKMVAARRAAARIVDSLTARDRFAVLSFDNVVERPDGLTEGLVPATDRHRYRAVEHLAGLRARGGTEMLAPLRQALGLLATGESRDRVLVLVTDGQVGNEDQILTELAAGMDGVRVHTVGIDRAVNAGFLGRLSALGGGRCELVESEDRLDEAMDRIHRRIATPLVTQVRLAGAEGFTPDPDSVTPARPPDVFPGVPVRIFGRYSGAPAGVATVTGVLPDGQPWEVQVSAVRKDTPAAAKVWARARLRDLEDRYLVVHKGREDLERTIVETSLRYGVLCRFTAYVAVDAEAVARGETLHRVVQPVELPSGWELTAAARAVPMAAAGPMGAPGAAGGAMRSSMARMAPAVFGAPPAPGGWAPLRGARRSSVDVAQLARTELERLRALSDASPLERWRALGDLASRLRALVAADQMAPDLARLVDELEPCDGPLPADPQHVDRLWRLALETLERLQDVGASPSPRGAVEPGARSGAQEPGGARPSRRLRAFWKRR